MFSAENGMPIKSLRSIDCKSDPTLPAKIGEAHFLVSHSFQSWLLVEFYRLRRCNSRNHIAW